MRGVRTIGGARARAAATIAACAASFAGVGSGVLFVGQPTARADSPSFRLEWDAPRGCPGEGYVRDAIEQLLAGGPRASVEVEARAVVGRTEAGAWRVRLTTVREGASGTRTLEAPSCRSLADATALIVALTIDPARVAANQPADAAAAAPAVDVPAVAEAGAAGDGRGDASADASDAGADAEPTPRTARGPSESPVRVAAPDRGPLDGPAEKRVGFAVFASAGGDLGSLPAPALGFFLGGAVLLRSLRIDAYGSYWLKEPAHAAFANVGVDVSLLAGGVRGCYLPFRRVLELGVCSGVEVGALFGEGFGVVSPSSGSRVWIAGTVAGRASWRILGPLSLALDLGIAIPFLRPTASLAGNPSAPEPTSVSFQSSIVAGRAILGAEVRF
jgi:hypothetical protein